MDTRAHLEEYRALREELETAVLPLAGSLDGRTFTFQASLHGLALAVGGYAVIEDAAGARLAQVLELESIRTEGTQVAFGDNLTTEVPIRVAVGSGTVLEGGGGPFHDALVRPARPDEVAAWLERTAPR